MVENAGVGPSLQISLPFTLSHDLMTSTAWRNSVAVGSSILRRVSLSQFQSFTVSSNLSFSPHFLRSTARTFAVSMANESGSGVVRFRVSPSTACVIQKGDITKWFIDGSSDAIVGDSIFLSLLRICYFTKGLCLFVYWKGWWEVIS